MRPLTLGLLVDHFLPPVVERIAVLRASRLGDLLLALHALTALRSACLRANDSGPRHLAAAVGAPTVGGFLAPNALSAGPLTARRPRIAGYDTCLAAGVAPRRTPASAAG